MARLPSREETNQGAPTASRNALNTRQQLYKKNRLSGMSKYNAARAAGYSENTALDHCKRLDEQIGIADAFERAGLTDKKLIEKHSQLLQATKVVGYLHNYKKSDNGGIEKAEPDECVSNEFVEVPDFGVQLKALELSYKVKGHLAEKNESNVAVQNNVIQFFQSIRVEETASSGDALSNLLGQEFVAQNLNGHRQPHS